MFKFIYDNKKRSIKDISKHTGFQYLHTINVLKQFQEENLIKNIFKVEEAKHKSEPGNPYVVELTKKGEVVHILLNILYQLHKGINEDEIIKKFCKGGEYGKRKN